MNGFFCVPMKACERFEIGKLVFAGLMVLVTLCGTVGAQSPSIDSRANESPSADEPGVGPPAAVSPVLTQSSVPSESPTPPSQPAEIPASGDVPLSDIPEPISPTPDPDAAEMILKTLKGETPPAAPGVLSDVLDVIRSQGSVLDGSSLDIDVNAPLIEPPVASRGASDFAPSSLYGSPPTQTASSFVETAESLLRSARMLESLAPMLEVPAGREHVPAGREPILPSHSFRHESVHSVTELVRRMRLQATQLLLREFPDAIQPR
ncbi:hypothetical protein FHS27_003432 [Rhodopirellula rubra]|uniref:Uncharacterized protein n=1 Tax=Aporhodopirellula rubra TaxID=980271 RepID=A0A7W5H5L1_9BACT|nr:hypothetical protein [Aporhodopirellula rubra]MBB3207607.1 hypothetical protein [Aporhodopirellula rubra]